MRKQEIVSKGYPTTTQLFLTIAAILFGFFISMRVGAHAGTDDVLVDHVQEQLGVSLQVPNAWSEKSIVRGNTEFFPTPTLGSFLMVTVLEPEKEDYSGTDLEFFMYDLLHMSKDGEKIKDFEYHKTTLSGLPAYEVRYAIEREKNFRVLAFFTAANEKIYMAQYQALSEKFPEYEQLIAGKIIPAFKIQVIHTLEKRYQFQELSEFGFSFYYPASWRVVHTEFSYPRMPLYIDPNTGSQVFLSSSSSETLQRSLRKRIAGEGAYLGRNDPVLIAADPESIVAVSVFGFAYRYEPADIIGSYVKGLREKIKQLDGFQHLRQFPIEIDKNLAMEYAYSYKDKKEGREQTIYVTCYITYANERLYHIQYEAPEENFSKHVKEVERLIKYFKFIPVK